MRTLKIPAAHLFAVAAFVAVSALLVFGADVALAAAPMSHAAAPTWLDHALHASPALLALRAEYSELQTRIVAKFAEIKDGLAPEAIRQIETDHDALVVKADGVKRQIDELERSLPTPPADPAGAAAAAAVAERTRIVQIQEIGQRGLLDQTVITAAVAGGVTVDAFRAQAFEQLAQRSTAQRINGGHVIVGTEESEQRARGIGDAIVARLAESTRALGSAAIAVPEHARAYMGMGFAEMAAECIGHRGAIRTSRQVMDVIERAFHTTSDFPGIFVDAVNRRLLARYQAAPANYRRFCALYTTTDFKPTHVIRAGDFPSLQPVSESGEIKAGTFSESKELFRVYPYGVQFNISRQMIVNDQMRAIDQMLGSASDRVIDWENAKAFAKLAANPTLATDNAVVFVDAGHANYTSVGTAISITSLGVGRAKMMKQTSLDGMKLNLSPATILTGPDRLTEAEQLAVSITPSGLGSAVPDWIKRLAPAGDANINGNTWYLFADPNVAPCFVYGYLDGFEGPRLKSEEKFGTQGLGVSLEHDFGVEAIDFRGGYKNNGAAPA